MQITMATTLQKGQKKSPNQVGLRVVKVFERDANHFTVFSIGSNCTAEAYS
jgi:hypothetical protein